MGGAKPSRGAKPRKYGTCIFELYRVRLFDVYIRFIEIQVLRKHFYGNQMGLILLYTLFNFAKGKLG